MFLQMGNNTIIRLDDVIGIFEIQKKSDMVKKLSHPDGRYIEVKDLTKMGNYASCIVTEKALYLSSISVGTLVRRAEDKFWINEAEFKDVR